MAEPIGKDAKLDHIQPTASTSQGETSEAIKNVDDKNLDEAARYLVNTEEYGPMTPEKEKKIVKKIDAWMIPIVSACIITWHEVPLSMY
jgi:hypothetical protein